MAKEMLDKDDTGYSLEKHNEAMAAANPRKITADMTDEEILSMADEMRKAEKEKAKLYGQAWNEAHEVNKELDEVNAKVGRSQIETGEEEKKENPVDQSRRNLDVVTSGEGVINKLGIKLEKGWDKIEELATLVEKISQGEIKKLPDNFQEMKQAVVGLRDRLGMEIGRDESKRYETSNDRLITSPEAEKIFDALQVLLENIDNIRIPAEKQPYEKPKVTTIEKPIKKPYTKPKITTIPSGQPLPPSLPGEQEKEILEPQELLDARREYAKMLRGKERMRWWKRPKTAEEISVENKYHELLKKFILDWAVNEVKRTEPTLESQEQSERIVALAAEREAKELRKVADIGVELYRDGKYRIAMNWLRKHPKLRLGVGLALTTGTVSTAALGLWPATAAFAVAKGTLAGASTAVGIEGTWDWLQKRREKKQGSAAILTDQEIQSLSEEEVMRDMSGNLALSLEKGTSFESDPERKATIEILEARRQADLETKYRGLVEQGLTPEQIVKEVMSEDLMSEHRDNTSEAVRRGNIGAYKRMAEATLAPIVGAFLAHLPFGHEASLIPSPSAVKENLSFGSIHRVGERATKTVGRILDQWESHTGNHIEGVDRSKVLKRLADMAYGGKVGETDPRWRFTETQLRRVWRNVGKIKL